MADAKDAKATRQNTALEERKIARRMKKRAIAAAKREETVVKLPRSSRLRAANRLGQKNFRTSEKARKAAKAAAAAKKTEAAPAAS